MTHKNCKNMIRALTILDKYTDLNHEYALEGRDKVIYAVASRVFRDMKTSDRETLWSLGWHWDDEQNCWACWTV